MTSLPGVLIVEDDAAIRGMLAAALGREALAVDCAGDGVAGLEKLASATYAVVIVDLMMPRMDGFAFLDAFRELTFPIRPVVFVMTAYDDAALVKLDAQLVHGSFKKPFDLQQVVNVVRDAAVTLHGANAPAIVPDALPNEAARDVC